MLSQQFLRISQSRLLRDMKCDSSFLTLHMAFNISCTGNIHRSGRRRRVLVKHGAVRSTRGDVPNPVVPGISSIGDAELTTAGCRDRLRNSVPSVGPYTARDLESC